MSFADNPLMQLDAFIRRPCATTSAKSTALQARLARLVGWTFAFWISLGLASAGEVNALYCVNTAVPPTVTCSPTATGNWSNAGNWYGLIGNGSAFVLHTIANNGNNGENYSVSIGQFAGQLTQDVASITVDNIQIGTLLVTQQGTSTSIVSGLSQIDFGTLQNAGTFTNGPISGALGSSLLVNGPPGFFGGLISNTSTGVFLNLSELDNVSGPIVNNGVFANYGPSPSNGTIYPGVLNNYSAIDPILGGGFTNNGTLYNTGTLNNIFGNTTDAFGHPIPAEIDNNGTLYNGAVVNTAGVSTNLAGTLNNGSGTVLNNNASGTFNNYVLGVLNNSGTLNNIGTLNNSGLLTNLSSGTLTNSGTLVNYSTLSNSGAIINTGSATLYNETTLNNSGTLKNAGTLSNSGTLTNLSPGTLTNSGTLDSGGTLNNSGILNNSGSSATLENFGGTLNNLASGTLSNSGTYINAGILNNSGTLNNSVGSATLNNSSGTLNNLSSGTLNNSGTLFNINAGILNNFGTLNNYGGVANFDTLNDAGTFNNFDTVSSTGTFTVAGTGVVNNTSLANMSLAEADISGTLKNDGIVIMTRSSPLTIESGGTLSGDGTVYGDVLNNGTLSPGDSPGTFIIDGNYTQTGTGAYLLELGGPFSGEYDQLLVTGTAVLGGTLEIELINGFVPSGQVFGFLDAGVRQGTFSVVDFLDCDGCSANLAFSGNQVSLAVTDTPEPSSISLLVGTVLFAFGIYWRRRHRVAWRYSEEEDS